MKPDIQKMTDDLLAQYLLGETDDAAAGQVEKWLNQSPANQAYYKQLKAVWDESIDLAPQQTIDETAAWERFSKKAQQRPAVQPVYRRMHWLKIAALVLVAALGSITYIIITQFKQRQPVTVAAIERPLTDTLPDGSVVVLNNHASLSYPTRFTGKERHVVLTGEGFFTVAHNKQQPFTVSCNGIAINVVGTSFNVKPEANGTGVIVETGRVLVTRNGQSILLLPGERVFVNNLTNSMAKAISTERLYMYYRNHTFVCDATPLEKLVAVLNKAYDANIVIENKSLSGLPISTTFNNEPLDKILSVIAETFGITVEKKDDRILLK